MEKQALTGAFLSIRGQIMAYRALYRRLRPQSFDDVVGQQHIIKTLKNQIETGRISHAYLFCGTRGTGKTSTAKIFARAINCEGSGEKPCNECEVCKSILSEQNVNVVELDAASHNGIDDIREITEEVKYPPTTGRYRVYIIDEVHQLSKPAFNALLKTLEEPPAHVVFILATTDPQQLLPTVISRCQRFDFHRIGVKEMTAVLAEYMQSEGVDIEEEALAYISEVSDGAMRDALSLLDMCMSFFYGEKITAEKVRDITGAVDKGVFFDLTDAIAEGNAAAALDIVENTVLGGRDIHQFIDEYVNHIRNLLVSRTVTESCAALDYSDSYIERLRGQSQKLTYDYLIGLIGQFSQLQSSVKKSLSPRIQLEVACIRACAPLTQNDAASLEKRIKIVEDKIDKGITVTSSALPQAPQEEKKTAVIKKAVPDDIKTIIGCWRDFVATVDDPALRITLKNEVQPAYLEEDILTIVCDYPSHFDVLQAKKDTLRDALKEFSQIDFNVRPMMRKQYDKRHTELYGGVDAELKASAEESLKTQFGDFIDIQEN